MKDTFESPTITINMEAGNPEGEVVSFFKLLIESVSISDSFSKESKAIQDSQTIGDLAKNIKNLKESVKVALENENKMASALDILKTEDILTTIDAVRSHQGELLYHKRYLGQILWAFVIENYNTKEDLQKVLNVYQVVLIYKRIH